MPARQGWRLIPIVWSTITSSPISLARHRRISSRRSASIGTSSMRSADWQRSGAVKIAPGTAGTTGGFESIFYWLDDDNDLKTNIGHLEVAAGIAGLVKAVLCVREASVPAHLNLTVRPSPAPRRARSRPRRTKVLPEYSPRPMGPPIPFPPMTGRNS